MNRKNNQRGFTLVELLLYIAVASTMLLAISVFLSTLLESRIKNQTIAEVEQQGFQAMHFIAQTARNAEMITLPAQGANASSLTLDVALSADDPTIFDLENGAIRVKEGAGPAVALTNSHIIVSALVFQNLSRTGTPGAIRVQFTLSHKNPENRNEYSFTKTFTASAALRQP